MLIFVYHKLRVGKFLTIIISKFSPITYSYYNYYYYYCYYFSSVNAKIRRRKRAYGWNHHTDDFVNGVGPDRNTCRARYQQSPVEVFARFLAVDQVNFS